jgi:hypothetical protein
MLKAKSGLAVTAGACCSSATALFELLSAAAWTGIIATDFLPPNRKLGFQLLFDLGQIVASVKALHNTVVQLHSRVQRGVGYLERRQ